ncbi:MAG: hypothetical protein ACOCRZ_03905 [Halothermotrichaceae bacterium]
MKPYVMAEDLYQHKLAVILGRGKRLKKILKQYPTEQKFKAAPIEEIASVIGIKNLQSNLLKKLEQIDITYDEMVTFRVDPALSKKPRAKKIMGIDTEYLKSDLDCIQYVLMEGLEYVSSGIIFTNQDIALSVSITEGINFLRRVINKFNPDIIVGHNFNSDITILESAYQDELPELYYFDDTMELLSASNLANIIGGSSLNKTVTQLFDADVIGLFTAYNNIDLLVEYGIKDAIYPICLRYFIMNGNLPDLNLDFKLGNILKKANRSLLKKDQYQITLSQKGG